MLNKKIRILKTDFFIYVPVDVLVAEVVRELPSPTVYMILNPRPLVLPSLWIAISTSRPELT